MSMTFVGNPLVALIDHLPLFSCDYTFVPASDGSRRLVLVMKVSEAILQCGHDARVDTKYREAEHAIAIRFDCDFPLAASEVVLPLFDTMCREALMNAAFHGGELQAYMVSEHAEQIMPKPLFTEREEKRKLQTELGKARVWQ